MSDAAPLEFKCLLNAWFHTSDLYLIRCIYSSAFVVAINVSADPLNWAPFIWKIKFVSYAFHTFPHERVRSRIVNTHIAHTRKWNMNCWYCNEFLKCGCEFEYQMNAMRLPNVHRDRICKQKKINKNRGTANESSVRASSLKRPDFFMHHLSLSVFYLRFGSLSLSLFLCCCLCCCCSVCLSLFTRCLRIYNLFFPIHFACFILVGADTLLGNPTIARSYNFTLTMRGTICKHPLFPLPFSSIFCANESQKSKHKANEWNTIGSSAHVKEIQLNMPSYFSVSIDCTP